MRKHLFPIVVLAAAAASCVDHRPLRNEVFDENVYLPKQFLTRENPRRPGSGDMAWLHKVTIVKGSVPEFGEWLFPGENAQARYVRFAFSNDKLEMIDDTEYAPLVAGPGDSKGPSPSLAQAVLNTWPGTHVDIQLRDNLDGERTNVIEENRERPWTERQHFKADLTRAAIPDVNAMGWYLDDFMRECLHPRSVSLVPGSFEMEQQGDKGGDDYLSWTLAVTYEYALVDGQYYCGNTLTDAMGRSTYTYHVKHSLWRPYQSDYKPIELKEKDPVRQSLGAFETGVMGRLSVYHDPRTDLPGARSMLMRFDPQKTHTFYFTESFPEKYKDHFRCKDEADKVCVARQLNDLFASINIPMRLEFKDWNDGGKERKFGDIRYSFLTYHNAPSTAGLIGMAYFNADPRSGELYAAGFNLYDWSDMLQMHLLKDYIKEISPDLFDDQKAPLGACKDGDQVKIDPKKVEDKYESTSLYSKLQTYMNQKPADWVIKHSADFDKSMRLLMGDLRFAYPPWNSYVQSKAGSWQQHLGNLRRSQARFQELSRSIDRGQSPFGSDSVLSPGGISKALEVLRESKQLLKNQMELRAYQQMVNGYRMADVVQGWELAPAMMRASRVCKGGKWETVDQWAERIIDNWFKFFAVHEFGHSLSLRHNFMGSMDKQHMDNGITSSVMEYSYHYIEAPEVPLYKPWDLMALKWIYGQIAPDPKEGWLYCTDEHSYLSPFCTVFDVGTTPTEIVKNEIDKYEWNYKYRNFRSFRKFWNTWSYPNAIAGALYPLRRFLNLWALDWHEVDLKNDLSLLGLKGDEVYFKNLTDEFRIEMGQANRLTANFYKAILQQSAAERSYATKFDNFYGDVTQQGIILDKFYAMLLFVGLWPVDDYDQNVYSYLAYHESSFGNSLYWSDVSDVVDSMIGGQYDVYPWFKPTAVLLFAQDTQDVMFGDRGKKRWIEMRRFDRVQDLTDFFGFDPRTQAVATDNPFQTFQDSKGGQWIYYYVADRNQHLVANKDLNPTAYKILWDQNESINVFKSGSDDDYEIKYYLDFYEYFN